MAYFLRNLEPTEAGKRLQLDEETIKNTMLVYRLKDDKWLYHGPYSEKRELEEDDIVIPVTSCYDGTERIEQGRVFANVIGSSADELRDDIVRSWIGLIAKGIVDYEMLYNHNSESGARSIALDEINACCMNSCYYKFNRVSYACKIGGVTYADYRNISYPIQCNINEQGHRTRIVGGHVTEGTINQVPKAGDSLFLMPICKRHNSGRWTDDGEKSIAGGRFYMITERNTYAIVLQNYLRGDMIKEHMSNHAVEKI